MVPARRAEVASLGRQDDGLGHAVDADDGGCCGPHDAGLRKKLGWERSNGKRQHCCRNGDADFSRSVRSADPQPGSGRKLEGAGVDRAGGRRADAGLGAGRTRRRRSRDCRRFCRAARGGPFAVALPVAETMLAGWLLARAGISSPRGAMSCGPARDGDRLTLTQDGTLAGRLRAVPFAREPSTSPCWRSARAAAPPWRWWKRARCGSRKAPASPATRSTR